jgi:pyrimidine-nucleoside phosphorylase
MMDSGESYDLKKYRRKCIDKHSTGGVGDKISLICAPIVASLGIKVPMMCGQGLGHTGGTVDKLESIPGFQTALTKKQFLKILENVGLVFSSQTEKIAPADKKIYALRDVTGTVENLSLITSSIMSKKLATGASGIVFDIKTGSGAFMKKIKDAEILAGWLIKTAKRSGRRVSVLITDMNEPLGCTVGNTLEVIESVETLRGFGPADILEISLAVSALMIQMAGMAKDFREAKRKAFKQIENGSALYKLEEVIHAQGGDAGVISENYKKWKKAKYVLDYKAEKNGFIKEIDAYKIGNFCCSLGAGRSSLKDKIDPSAGLILFAKKGDKVSKGETIARIYTDKKDPKAYLKDLGNIIKILGRKLKTGNKVLKKIVI